MRARWRLGLILIEVAILEIGTYLAVEELLPPEVWFASGLLAVVINPILLEPFYPRPYDVIANSLIGLVLFSWSPRLVAAPGWYALVAFLAVASLLAIVALMFGAAKDRPPTIARAARSLSSYATSRVIYSAIFWLSLLEQFPVPSGTFWTLGVTWSLVFLIGSVNWEHLWASVSRGPAPGRVEGLLGPATLLVTAADLPPPGSAVSLESRGMATEGIIVTRIRRLRDTWGQVHVVRARDVNRLLRARSLTITEGTLSDPLLVGSVGAGSTERRLIFNPAAALEIGNVVAVRMNREHILYQVESARVDEMKIRGGSHLVVSSAANQIGRFDATSLRLVHHRWIPEPGAPVLRSTPELNQNPEPPENSLRLGVVIGTSIPVCLDLDVASEGHIVILGMTKMGKTTLAMRLAGALAQTRGVVILDQTGEYRAKRLLEPHVPGEWEPGISVHEPPQGTIGPDFALGFVQATFQAASAEYEAGATTPRSIMMDEAHQFVPEPTGLGYGAPGRDSAYQLGVEIMQLRKFGISMTLISQRTAVVAKSALSQCETMIAFRSVDQTGLDYLEQIAGGGVRNLLPTLRQGEALVLGTAVSSDRPVAISVEAT